MNTPEYLPGLLTALGVGLMIGVVRERRHQPDLTKAGTRTHPLVAMVGYVSWSLGIWPFVVTVLVVGGLVIRGYQATARADPGQTGEVALLLTLMLSALAHQDSVLAAGLGVLAAALMYAKQASQRISRELITDQELQDALLLAAAALVVMPLLSDDPVDPWNVLRLATLWRIVLLVMAVGMLGHLTRRFLGERWGMPVAGFFSGFVSSTAVVMTTGQLVREGRCNVLPAATAALLANLASLMMLAGVIAAISSSLLADMRGPLLMAAIGLLLVALPCSRRTDVTIEVDNKGRAFKLTHAMLLSGTIALMTLLANWMRHVFGDVGVLVAALCVAWVEVHAAAVSVAQLLQTGHITTDLARWSLVAVMASSALAKTTLAFVSGGIRYGIAVGLGLLAMVIGASAGIGWTS